MKTTAITARFRRPNFLGCAKNNWYHKPDTNPKWTLTKTKLYLKTKKQDPQYMTLKIIYNKYNWVQESRVYVQFRCTACWVQALCNVLIISVANCTEFVKFRIHTYFLLRCNAIPLMVTEVLALSIAFQILTKLEALVKCHCSFPVHDPEKYPIWWARFSTGVRRGLKSSSCLESRFQNCSSLKTASYSVI